MKLGLGTVQLGLPYGVTNRRGQASPGEAAQLFTAAAESGIELLDTAPVYGAAERLVGKALAAGLRFRVVTKTATRAPGASAVGARTLLRETFLRSLENLGLQRVTGLLLHHCRDALAPGGHGFIEEMRMLKREGLAERIGVSIYDAGELEAVLEIFTPDIVQLPLSAFDQRLARSGHLARLRELGVEVHARSVFLQGVLLAAPASLPEFLAPLRGKLGDLQDSLRAAGYTILEGALGYIARRPEVAVAIVGATDRDELLQIATAAGARVEFEFERFAVDDEALLNPARWPAAVVEALQ